MRAYVVSRLAQTALVVFLSLTAVFVMVRLSGDPVLLFMPMDIQAKDVTEFRQRLGFNDPLPVQYVRFVGGAMRGDFGESLRYRRDALGLVLERLPATLLLAGTSLLLTVLVAIPLGVVSAVRRDSVLDHVGTISTVLGQATPGFWLGLLLIYLFSVQLRWLPTGGMGGLAHLVMPSVVLAAFYSARIARLTRSAVLEVLGEDYILTARAKGLGEGRVIGKHTLRNSAIPIVTLAGLEAGQILGGAVITETIFAWPGLGRRTVARGARSAANGLRAEPQAAGCARSSLRHRSARPRSARAHSARGTPGALHRRLHRHRHRGRRRAARSRRRVRRALALDRADASRRRPALVSVHPAGDDDQRDRRARPAQHHPQPFGGGMGRVCSRGARRGPLGEATRLRPCGGGARHGTDATHVPSRAAQRRAVHHRGRESPVLVVHRRRGGNQLSRIRRAAADAGVGQHALREPRLPLCRLVARRVPRRGPRIHGARRQFARRLVARHPGPQAPGLRCPPAISSRISRG